jgi:1,4-alpha-glucan branching enzyme
MPFTVSTTEILQIANAEYADPHRILGMHIIGEDVFVRTFVPNAESITVINPITDERWVMQKIHDSGFYETQIKGQSKWFDYMLEVIYESGIHIAHDPYAFAPVLTEYDMHLWSKGTHYKIWEKLGANPIIVRGVAGVNFAVWAPNAVRVSVIGKFNNYDGRRHPMRFRPDGGIWELFIPDLGQFETYKFEIKTQSGEILQKADPFAKFHQLRPSTN